jgi:predicted O-linked N-acetylglucosamine transferase (SPINDLY family)
MLLQLWLEKLRRRLKRDPVINAAYSRVRFAKKLSAREMAVLMKVADVVVDTFPVGMGVAALEV